MLEYPFQFQTLYYLIQLKARSSGPSQSSRPLNKYFKLTINIYLWKRANLTILSLAFSSQSFLNRPTRMPANWVSPIGESDLHSGWKTNSLLLKNALLARAQSYPLFLISHKGQLQGLNNRNATYHRLGSTCRRGMKLLKIIGNRCSTRFLSKKEKRNYTLLSAGVELISFQRLL